IAPQSRRYELHRVWVVEANVRQGMRHQAPKRMFEQATTFYYFPGQRRVRRMPSYSYDAPQIGLDNQYTVDEANVFFGTMDRFDWKLIGKQELLVPYNDFGAYDTGAKVETFAGNDSIAPQSRRYELHRVWVVEANVRQGMRHQAPKRMF
ncbi:DUF1329 domain-containing protein, partial [Klebsiella pneumoniae subsp. pneumoniae]